MALDPTAPAEAWDLDLVDDRSPADYLIAHLTGEIYADSDSLEKATICVLAMGACQFLGLDSEHAADWACEQLERGATIRWNGAELSFDFDEAGA